MALEIINDIPAQALVIYTDGSRSDKDRAGSGIYCKIPEGDLRCNIRNSDHCSVFRSKLIAISKAFDYALCSSSEIMWILTDSRSSIQYLKNWPKIMDKTGQDIVSKLFELGQHKSIYLQWITSHVGVYGNETADNLARKGCDLPTPTSTDLCPTEFMPIANIKLIRHVKFLLFISDISLNNQACHF
ncbi:Ribonuclease H1, partial [Stegodyphus mimosarum]